MFFNGMIKTVSKKYCFPSWSNTGIRYRSSQGFPYELHILHFLWDS